MNIQKKIRYVLIPTLGESIPPGPTGFSLYLHNKLWTISCSDWCLISPDWAVHPRTRRINRRPETMSVKWTRVVWKLRPRKEATRRGGGFLGHITNHLLPETSLQKIVRLFWWRNCGEKRGFLLMLTWFFHVTTSLRSSFASFPPFFFFSSVTTRWWEDDFLRLPFMIPGRLNVRKARSCCWIPRKQNDEGVLKNTTKLKINAVDEFHLN